MSPPFAPGSLSSAYITKSKALGGPERLNKKRDLHLSRFHALGDPGHMGLLLRFVRLLPLAAVAAVPVLATAACNAQPCAMIRE